MGEGKKTKSIEEIVTDYLRTNGFDGLAGNACGCTLGTLFPCTEIEVTGAFPCRAGHLHKCKKEDCDTCFGVECDGFYEGVSVLRTFKQKRTPNDPS